MATSDTPSAFARSLVACASALPRPLGRPLLLGITGPPGVGKSTAAADVAEGLTATGTAATVVPMDGFHLAGIELARLGRADRKGAPDTFDVHGLLSLLQRLRDARRETIYAPRFHREIEESIAGEVRVDPSTELVVVEGNYLLLDVPGWRSIRPLLDVCWYLEAADDEVRIARLVRRHVEHGRAPDDARAWVQRSDEANARVIEQTRNSADLVITVP